MCEVLNKMARQLEMLTAHHMLISQGLDQLESNARNSYEIIVVNVMRESFFEVLLEEQPRKTA